MIVQMTVYRLFVIVDAVDPVNRFATHILNYGEFTLKVINEICVANYNAVLVK